MESRVERLEASRELDRLTVTEAAEKATAALNRLRMREARAAERDSERGHDVSDLDEQLRRRKGY